MIGGLLADSNSSRYLRPVLWCVWAWGACLLK